MTRRTALLCEQEPNSLKERVRRLINWSLLKQPLVLLSPCLELTGSAGAMGRWGAFVPLLRFLFVLSEGILKAQCLSLQTETLQGDSRWTHGLFILIKIYHKNKKYSGS